MNKITKSLLTVGAACALAVTSFAAGNMISISVDPSVKILVNGAEFKPKDANGNAVMTFIYNGTTYAPLRALAEAYGLEVGYDAARNMATVSEPGKSYDTPAVTTQPETITLGMKNALKKADEYLRFMAFSYTGLIKQLEYERFSHDEAVYAVDNCGADWYEQAVKKGYSYLDFMSFSRDGLIRQLEYEGFTTDQAVYAVNELGY